MAAFRKTVAAATLLASSALIPGVSAEVIELNDGSRIQGEVISLQNGIYRIRTDSLGTISLSQGKVRSISQGGASAPQSSTDSGSAAVKSIQQSMVQDAGIMETVRSLQSSPEMQAVLKDPEVMQAVQSFDLEALARHPKIKALMNNPDIKKIQGRVAP